MSKKQDFQLQRWKLLIEERINSGKTVNDWCDANGVSRHAYYYWLAKLREEHYDDAVQSLPAVTPPANTFVEISPGQSCQTPATLPAGTQQAVVVIQKGSMRIEIFPEVSALILQQLMGVVSNAET